MVTKFHSQWSHSTLLEVSRKALVNKSRVQSRKRFQRRLNYQVSNFRGVDLEQLFENDYFVFRTPIKDYVCIVAFPGVFSSLRDVVKSTHGDPKRINLQMVIKALRLAFDATDDVKVDCTCPDFWYRFSYVATQNGYKYGKPQTIPAPITNPDDDIGSTCKHLSLLLSNKQWVVKAASVVNAFIKAYPDKAAHYLYDESEIVDNEDEVKVADEVEEIPDEVVSGTEVVDDEVKDEPQDAGVEGEEETPDDLDSNDNDEVETPATSRRTPKKVNQKRVNRKIAKKSRQRNRNKESLGIPIEEVGEAEEWEPYLIETQRYIVSSSKNKLNS